jgi:hypothetical protein
MPSKLIWTDARDCLLRRLHTEGATWDVIAATLSVSRYTAIERGRRIGARKAPLDHKPLPEDLARDPLPPGHSRTWGVLTHGTVLAGTPYPFPVFGK